MVPIDAMSLPIEVWLTILRHATAVRFLFDCSPPEEFGYSPDRRPEVIQERVLQSLHMKRTVLQVCKLWYKLARPFLYEALIIRRPLFLLRLLGVRELMTQHFNLYGSKRMEGRSKFVQWMTSLDINAGEGGLDFLHLIRRLDIRMDFFEDGDSDLMPLLHLLMRGATNLEILTMKLSCPSYLLNGSLLDFPLPAGTQSLRMLDISSKMPHSDSWVEKLSNVIHKQPLQRLRVELPKSDETVWREYQMSIPEINCLSIPNRMFASLHTPSLINLTHLIIGYSFFMECGCIQKWSLFGRNLLFLDIPNAALWAFGPDPPRTMTLMQSIAQWCPKLQDLVFSFRKDDAVHLEHLDFLPPVKHLGLRMDDGVELAPSVWSSVTNCMPKLLEATPSIQVVRDLSKRSALRQFQNPPIQGYFERTSAVRKVCRRILEKYSVRVEDYTGHLICS